MYLTAIGMTMLGIIFLTMSLKPIHIICKKEPKSGWKLLFLLILLFITGYIASIFHIAMTDEFTIVYLAHSAILLSGSIFVVLVSRLSLKSLISIETAAESAHYTSLHDSLTGLKNRKAFLNTMANHIEKKQAFTLLLIDLNNFKQINDALGHYYGDRLLHAIAEKLNEILPQQCTLFRMGGDEFTLLWENNSAIILEEIVNLIHMQLSQSFMVQNYSLTVGASIGVSSYPESSTKVNELLQQADTAMYASKQRKAPYVIFSEEMNDGVQEKLNIAIKLQQALANQEFQLYYQPIIKSPGKQPHGAEALLRWPQPDGSFIGPDKFIPVAEESAIINDITFWVVNQCVKDLKMLEQHGFSGALHINLSAKDLHNNALAELLKQQTANARLTPDKLILEITESAMMTDIDQAKSIMKNLAEHGFTFSIDDFGTGFSSLSLLRDLPLSQIKIDRSFVADIDNNEASRSIVDSIIYLAKTLECSVVAEGVENETISTLLEVMHCDYQQGYHFSKPLSLVDYINYLSESEEKSIRGTAASLYTINEKSIP